MKMIFHIFIALVLDILAFTMILPLFPRLMAFYQQQYVLGKDPFFGFCLEYIQWWKEIMGGSGSHLDIVLFGGAIGSLFSFLQFLSSPWIGRLSDWHGRKVVLLWSMIGNILSACLWLFSNNFLLFVLSRVVGGLSEGNVQLSIAMITDMTHPKQRSKGLALVGIAFALGFTVGPAMGAYFASIDLMNYFPLEGIHHFSATAGLCMLLLIIETIYIWLFVPETRKGSLYRNISTTTSKQQKLDKIVNWEDLNLQVLSFANFLYLFFFSGLEFTLTFLTFDRFNYTNMQQGKLLGLIGILSSLIQGGYVRRLAHKIGERQILLQGLVMACLASIMFSICGTSFDFFQTNEEVFGKNNSISLYFAAFGFAFASATVVNCLTSVYSLFITHYNPDAMEMESRRGEILGYFRSVGQLGRTLGPITACTLYWWLGGVSAYLFGAFGIFLVWMTIYFGLETPQQNQTPKLH